MQFYKLFWKQWRLNCAEVCTQGQESFSVKGQIGNALVLQPYGLCCILCYFLIFLKCKNHFSSQAVQKRLWVGFVPQALSV